MARITIAALQAQLEEARAWHTEALNTITELKAENNALVQELDTLRKGQSRQRAAPPAATHSDFRARCIAAREEAKRTGFAVRV